MIVLQAAGQKAAKPKKTGGEFSEGAQAKAQPPPKQPPVPSIRYLSDDSFLSADLTSALNITNYEFKKLTEAAAHFNNSSDPFVKNYIANRDTRNALRKLFDSIFGNASERPPGNFSAEDIAKNLFTVARDAGAYALPSTPKKKMMKMIYDYCLNSSPSLASLIGRMQSWRE